MKRGKTQEKKLASKRASNRRRKTRELKKEEGNREEKEREKEKKKGIGEISIHWVFFIYATLAPKRVRIKAAM